MKHIITLTLAILTFTLSSVAQDANKQEEYYQKFTEILDEEATYFENEEYDKALEMAQKALKYAKEHFDEISYPVAHAYYIIGSIYLAQEELGKAKLHFIMSMDILFRMGLQEKNENNPYFLESGLTAASLLNNLGEIYIREENYKRAEKVLENALKLKKELYSGIEIETTLVSLYNTTWNLAYTKYKLGKTKEAKKLLKEATKILKKLDVPKNSQSYNDIQDLLNKMK